MSCRPYSSGAPLRSDLPDQAMQPWHAPRACTDQYVLDVLFRLPQSAAEIDPLARVMEAAPEKKRGRSGLERPKSREETPKEGYDRASYARDVAPQNLRVRCTIFKCIFCRAAHPQVKGSAGSGRIRGKKAVRATNGPSLGRKRPSGQTAAIRIADATALSRYELVRLRQQRMGPPRRVFAGDM